jgi:hypothetical protein
MSARAAEEGTKERSFFHLARILAGTSSATLANF